MATQIVNINVSRTVAPAPSTLQQTGSLISQGGTTLTTGTRSLLTEFLDLTPLLTAPKALTSLAWAANVVTATASVAHGITTGQTFPVIIAGAVPVGYNGTFTATATTATAFTYPLLTNPGTETTPGTYTSGATLEITSMAQSFFSQGNGASVYVLELGTGTATTGIAALSAYTVANPNADYGYLVPRSWAADGTMVALANLYAANEAKKYFYVTPTMSSFAQYTGIKSINMLIEAPTVPVTEFSQASQFYQLLVNAPSNINKVAPFAYRFAIGMTPFPVTGPQQTSFKAAGLNYIGTGAEGGIANTIAYYGRTADQRDMLYWYSVDWVQINLKLDLANEVINGSNNPINPLYYDQPGIDRLQARAQQTMNRGVTFGMINTSQPPVVDAVPFITYTIDNPSDYPLGRYAGLSTTFVPSIGFIEIDMNVNVTDFITA